MRINRTKRQHYITRRKSKRNRENRVVGGSVGVSTNIIKVAVGSLNQTVMDFIQNYKNIKNAIAAANLEKVQILALPELSVCGYSCQDHFYETDTYEMSYQVVLDICKDTKDIDMLIAVGCPVIHKNVRYNATIFIHKGKVIFVRPKQNLADDGNYREARWFTPWTRPDIEIFEPPNNIGINMTDMVAAANGIVPPTAAPTESIKIGIGLIELKINNTTITIGADMCEELWVPNPTGANMYLDGADILINVSGSHYEAGKLERRKQLINDITHRCGGIYMYSNAEGGDGDRLYFDGASMIGMNGKMYAETDRFKMRHYILTYAIFNVRDILTHRTGNNSYQLQSSQERKNFPRILCNMSTTVGANEKCSTPQVIPANDMTGFDAIVNSTQNGIALTKLYDKLYNTNTTDNKLVDPEFTYKDATETHEIMMAAACWLWDYMRKSGQAGFLLPLSGGADSAATASIVYMMCMLIMKNNEDVSGSSNTINAWLDARVKPFTIIDKSTATIGEPAPSNAVVNPVKDAHGNAVTNANSLCKFVLSTFYLPTKISGLSASNTALLAEDLSKQYGSYHHTVGIEDAYTTALKTVTSIPIDRIKEVVAILRDYNFIRNNLKDHKAKLNAALRKRAEVAINDISAPTPPTTLPTPPAADTAATAATSPPTPPAGADTPQKNNTMDFLDKQRIEHMVLNLNKVITAIDNVINATKVPMPETWSFWHLPYQNIQARMRMVIPYLIQQTIIRKRGEKGVEGPPLLNLGSSNSDEIYVGYYTKYDASAADINPIGSLPKKYINNILKLFAFFDFKDMDPFNLKLIAENNLAEKVTFRILNQDPTAELVQSSEGINQTDETDIKLTYKRMTQISTLMAQKRGIYECYLKLRDADRAEDAPMPASITSADIKTFFTRYRINRNKATIIPASVHLLSISPDDNRYTLRPVAYPTATTEYNRIDEAVKAEQPA